MNHSRFARSLKARWILQGDHRRALVLAMDWVDSVGARTRVAFKRSGEAFRDETARLHDEVNALCGEDGSRFGRLVRRLGISRRRLASVVDGWNAYYVRGVSRDARQLDALLGQWSGAPMLLGVEIMSSGQELTPEAVRGVQQLGMARGLLDLMMRLEEELDESRHVFPLDELERFNVPRTDLAERRRGPGFRDLWKFQLDRAREWAAEREEVTTSLPTRSAHDLVRVTRKWCMKTAEALEKRG